MDRGPGLKGPSKIGREQKGREDGYWRKTEITGKGMGVEEKMRLREKRTGVDIGVPNVEFDAML